MFTSKGLSSRLSVAPSRESDEEKVVLNRKGCFQRADMLIYGMFNEQEVKTQGARWLFLKYI